MTARATPTTPVTPVLPATTPPPAAAIRPQGPRGRGWVFHAAMVPFTLLWIAPMVFVVTVAFRSFEDIAARGLGVFPASFMFDGFNTALRSGIGQALANSVLVTSVAVLASLFLASIAAFALSRFHIPFGRTILLVMLAGNLLPPQVLLIPVAKITESIGIYDSLFALIFVQVGFGLGFYTFVLHGFMRGIPGEILEAATVDGAGPARIYARIILPLCRPALAALGALATTWIFNDLIWAVTVLRTETRFPITAALLNLQGGFVSNWNVVAAGAVLAALPTAIVFFVFQKHFVSGLLVGANK